jgi:hydrogenase nickel incorporation protein HypA/HybF
MHELSLAENMLDMIQQRAETEQFKQVDKVWLEIGSLSHVEADAMAFCFDAVMAGTLAEGAKLEIIHTQAQGKCRQCQQTNTVEHLYDPCPQCGQFGVDILQGDQVRIKSLSVQ